MLHTNFQGHRSFESREDDCFSGSYHMWSWWPSWSCDLNRFIKLLLPHPIEAPHKILLQSAKQFLRKKKFENVESE